MRRLLALCALLAWTVASGPALANGGQDFAQVERGRYLAIAGDCAACHTKSGGVEFAGGRAIETPFGKIVSPNITPDNQTGIGLWSDEDFVRALTQGVRRDGSHLFPAMPYPYYTKVRREDVLAIRAYLETLAPVSNSVVADQLPFPLNIRSDLAAWNQLNFTPGEFRPVAGKSEEWNRGAYLAEGLMHCGSCHTPKNISGGDKTSEALQGYPRQGWFAPALTTDRRRGLGSWTTDDVVTYLKTGHNRFAGATGPMADEVKRSSSKMSEADLHAVATWLKDQPAPKESAATPIERSNATMKLGAAVYEDECSACHAPMGEGVSGLFPALAGSASVQSANSISLIHVVLAGTQTVATDGAPTAPSMPGFGWLLSDHQAAAVLTYIRNAWGNAAPRVSPDDVAKSRASLAKSASGG